MSWLYRVARSSSEASALSHSKHYRPRCCSTNAFPPRPRRFAELDKPSPVREPHRAPRIVLSSMTMLHSELRAWLGRLIRSRERRTWCTYDSRQPCTSHRAERPCAVRSTTCAQVQHTTVARLHQAALADRAGALRLAGRATRTFHIR